MKKGLITPVDVKLMNLSALTLMLVFAFLVTGALLRWVSRHPMFYLGDITVSGDVAHNSAATLRSHVVPKLGGTFFTLELPQVRQSFESAPWVRQALVRRVFPNHLKVTLQEHQAVAYWGEDSDTLLVNSFGEVFEANTGEIEQDKLPRLIGPNGQSADVWAMFSALQPVYATMNINLEQLELTGRGGWRASFDTGADIELGRGSIQDVVARSKVFLATVEQVTSHYARKLDALDGADLRYPQGYAIRLRGVTTGALESNKQ